MNLRDFKEWVNKLTEEQLEHPLLFISEEYSISGRISKIERAKVDLYYTGEDDPSPLYTKKQLKEEGYDNDDIANFDIEIPKGSFYFRIGV